MLQRLLLRKPAINKTRELFNERLSIFFFFFSTCGNKQEDMNLLIKLIHPIPSNAFSQIYKYNNGQICTLNLYTSLFRTRAASILSINTNTKMSNSVLINLGRCGCPHTYINGLSFYNISGMLVTLDQVVAAD